MSSQHITEQEKEDLEKSIGWKDSYFIPEAAVNRVESLRCLT